jgi:amino acid adenylation domain-containing protein
MLVTVLGVLEAHAAYVPFDEKWPAVRAEQIVADTRAAAVVADATTLEAVLHFTRQSACTAVLCIDERFELRVVRAASVVPSLDVDLHALLSAVPNSDLCYVLYTSGTTGLPKGVAVAHTGVVNQISAVGSSVVSADDVRVTLFTTSLCFDASLDEIFLPLSLGGCIVVADNLLVLADADAAQRFSDVTFLNGTPSAMQMVVELHALPRSVRAIELGGEALSAALVRQLYDAGVARVANVYGPTECTNECIVSILPRHPPDRIPIGRPIAGVEAYVVGADGQRVTHDATGELLIGGAGVAFGYLRRPEQTAERFVVNPFGSGRVYRTGDVVRVLADGQLEFVGRVDNQVKVRGFRIELEEVEAALAACAHVAAACVSVQDGQLVAHVMPSGRDLSLLDAAALRSAMAARVPAYMVPAAFQFIEELPLAVTGKVDRKALPPVRLGTAVVATATAGAAEPPSSDVERQILAAWRDVLCAPHIGVLDNFYDIGGNSLAAVRIVARCRAAGLERVSIKLLRDHNTVRALSDAIATAVANNSVDSSDASADVMLPADASARLAKFDVGERRDELCDVYTLTPLQAGMLFFTLKEPTAGVYADQWLCDLVGELDVDALQQSWQRVVHKHDSLRASFLWHELEEPLQLVWRNVALAWSVVDLVGVDESARDTTIESFLRRDRARGFQLDSAPLMRFALFCVEPRRHVFVWTSHHILMDGWSLPLILHDVFGGAGERVAPKFAPFVRHLLAQRSRHASAREFWRAQLASLPERRELPFALPRIVPPDEPFPQVSVTFDAELGARVFACARSLRVTPSTVLQGAWLLLLSCLTDSSDVVTGMTVAGRPPELTDVETTVGNFLNALPLIARIEPSESVADFFGKLQRSLVALAEFDDLPLVDIQRLAPSDGGSLFDSLVVFEDVCTADYGRAFGADVTAVRWFETTNFLLTFAFAIGEHGGVLNVTFDATRLTRARCEWFVGRYVALLESCVRDTQRPASRLEVVGERADLRGWNDTQCVVPDLCLHQLLERQCTATPAALAVVDDSVRWSYSELLAAVNRVAAAAGADRLIGILMSRTAALVAAVYGVLSAGAAYVPLDAGWPAERIAFVAGDAELSTVLTDSATWQRSGGALLEAAHAIGVRVTPLFVDELLSRADSGAPAAPAPSRICSPTSLAYVLYTSGTTGKPKGVCVEHRSVVNEVWHMGTRILTPPDLHCALFSTSVCFDASVDELFVPLAFGGRIVVVPSVLALCDATAAARLRANGDDVTLLNGTPSAIQMLVDTGQVPRSVRVVILGGEALPRRTADGLFATLGHDVRIFNVYGPTEATDLCLVERVLPGDTGAPLLGFAISNMCTHVVSTRSLMPLPVGVPGELVVQGVGVARGYWRRDELTRERFLEPTASPHWRASDGRARIARAIWCGDTPTAGSSTWVASIGR